MNFLLDTMILSEFRKRSPNARVVRWLQEKAASELFPSVVTIGEVERGISKQRRLNPAFAERLSDWLQAVLLHYRDRILPVDISIARRWGMLDDRHHRAGADLLIVATALEYGLIVITRNARHFEPTGAPVLNPFEPV
uniref:Ribonuclease VapC n=1 Tax=Candidatus Kentrum eta TaxID=2126337 RepID=A0A450UTV1_9GAMM|nr:MAG: hypothetical protein BECKH772A_GA0070896_100938 [Candidatus Kentron sp. H]VFJ97715.1 MAG: hypothetical protein BECKH772B_GA0070898_101178 [Candidatus Kentron sp. H]VFK02951.1 MAG: hypothetical protein BECKH772C_GA0070978_101098 [Candidatus Kentron sp. H]